MQQKVVSVKCGGCGNHCQLTVNTFADGRKYISGNRCDKPVTGKSADDSLDLYAYKQELLASYKPVRQARLHRHPAVSGLLRAAALLVGLLD